jgi:hypothetical protein
MQLTVKKEQIRGKAERFELAAKKRVAEKLEEAINYLSYSVPVDTGAYANSMHLNPRGDVSGHGETSHRKPRQVAADPVLNEMESRMRASLETIDLLDGATIVNNSPHARFVEIYHGLFDQLRSALR